MAWLQEGRPACAVRCVRSPLRYILAANLGAAQQPQQACPGAPGTAPAASPFVTPPSPHPGGTCSICSRLVRSALTRSRRRLRSFSVLPQAADGTPRSALAAAARVGTRVHMLPPGDSCTPCAPTDHWPRMRSAQRRPPARPAHSCASSGDSTPLRNASSSEPSVPSLRRAAAVSRDASCPLSGCLRLRSCRRVGRHSQQAGPLKSGGTQHGRAGGRPLLLHRQNTVCCSASGN